MADAYFEYTDAQGKVHRVDDITKVPKKYIPRTTAVGVEATKEEPAHQAFQLPPLDYTYLLPVICAVVVIKYKNFLVRSMAIALFCMWAVYLGWGFFMRSEYSHTSERASVTLERTQQAEEERRQALKKRKAAEEFPQSAVGRD